MLFAVVNEEQCYSVEQGWQRLLLMIALQLCRHGSGDIAPALQLSRMKLVLRVCTPWPVKSLTTP